MPVWYQPHAVVQSQRWARRSIIVLWHLTIGHSNYPARRIPQAELLSTSLSHSTRWATTTLSCSTLRRFSLKSGRRSRKDAQTSRRSIRFALRGSLCQPASSKSGFAPRGATIRRASRRQEMTRLEMNMGQSASSGAKVFRLAIGSGPPPAIVPTTAASSAQVHLGVQRDSLRNRENLGALMQDFREAKRRSAENDFLRPHDGDIVATIDVLGDLVRILPDAGEGISIGLGPTGSISLTGSLPHGLFVLERRPGRGVFDLVVRFGSQRRTFTGIDEPSVVACLSAYVE